MVDAAFYRLLHGAPNLHQILPDVLVLALVNVLPVATSVILAPLLYLVQRVLLIHLALVVEPAALLAFRQCAAAYAVAYPLVHAVAFGVERYELHAVRVIGQEHLRLPHDAQRSNGAQHFVDCYVCHVTSARCCQAAV